MKIAVIGGHMSPALAVIQALPKDAEIVYIGRKHPLEGDKAVSLEYQIITSLGIRFIPLTTGRLQRTLTRHTIPSLTKMPKGFMLAFRLLKKEKPAVILSFGGYLSIPICFTAYLLKIPVVIHEQTRGAGIANKIVSFFACKICISWESSKKFFPSNKTVLTGDPILHTKPTSAIGTYEKKEKDIPLVVFAGGSQGSHAINLLVEESLAQLLEKFHIIHQTGDAQEFKDFDRLQKKKTALPFPLQNRYQPVKFIHPFDIEYIFKEADMVVSRSGVNTMLLLLQLHKPTLFIPLPFGQRNEQLTNATYFKETGLGEIALQKKLTGQMLLDKITTMIQNLSKYIITKEIPALTIHAYAAQRITNILYDISTDTEKKKENPI